MGATNGVQHVGHSGFDPRIKQALATTAHTYYDNTSVETTSPICVFDLARGLLCSRPQLLVCLRTTSNF